MAEETAATAYLDGLGKSYRKWRRKGFDFLLAPGGHQAMSGPEAKDVLHRGGNRSLTNLFGTVVPPEIARNFSDAVYLGNEVATGTMAKARGVLSGEGTPFFSKYGFNWEDVARNRLGQDQGVADLRAKWDAAKMRMGEPGRTIYRGVE